MGWSLRKGQEIEDVGIGAIGLTNPLTVPPVGQFLN
jgi:hypothetical protein